VRWQIGVALACSLIEVNAFDEPDVASAKRATHRVLASGATSGGPFTHAASALADFGHAPAGDGFIAIHAYVDRTPWTERILGRIRRRLSERYRVPVAIEFGPALLHATGQYYKGGPPGGLVIQLVGTERDLPIPGRRYGFAGLLAAQAQGDAHAMLAAGRRVAITTVAELQSAVESLATRRASRVRNDVPV
jgi:hypothetical protein